ncbi:MAG: hypothetical protein JWQ87_4752 [Candidatus Sulfotelmatobacter sp.]|nr:hypothetical protein [Candidatus Sulfotelmatobacter sp.]
MRVVRTDSEQCSEFFFDFGASLESSANVSPPEIEHGAQRGHKQDALDTDIWRRMEIVLSNRWVQAHRRSKPCPFLHKRSPVSAEYHTTRRASHGGYLWLLQIRNGVRHFSSHCPPMWRRPRRRPRRIGLVSMFSMFVRIGLLTLASVPRSISLQNLCTEPIYRTCLLNLFY